MNKNILKIRGEGISIRIIYLTKRSLAKFALFLIVIIAFSGVFSAAIISGAADAMQVLVAGANKLHPIYAVDTTEKKVAFSFDATWGCSRTPLILQTLEEYNIRTTFFLTNIWLNSYPQVAQEIVSQGHEPALHTANHPDLTKKSDESIRQELLENAAKVEEVTSKKANLFRPPFGAYNNRVITIAEEEKMIPIQWSIDSLDWKNLSAEEITQRITSRIKPGAIILFHNDGANTPQALKPVIEWLLKEEYSIVPISELIYQDNYYIDVNGIQKSRNIPQKEALKAEI